MLFAAGSPSNAACTSCDRRRSQVRQSCAATPAPVLRQFRGNARTTSASIWHCRPDAPVDFLGQPGIDRVDQIADVILDVGALDILAAEIAGIDDFQQIIQNLNDRSLVGKRRGCEVLELRLQAAEGLQHLARDRRESDRVSLGVPARRLKLSLHRPAFQLFLNVGHELIGDRRHRSRGGRTTARA